MTASGRDCTASSGNFARVYRVIYCLPMIFLLACITANYERLSTSDLGFWSIVLGLIMIRFTDVQFLHFETVEGAPATMDDWRAYAVGLLYGGLGAWLIAHCFNHLL